jgi:hypothetical protein
MFPMIMPIIMVVIGKIEGALNVGRGGRCAIHSFYFPLFSFLIPAENAPKTNPRSGVKIP